MPAQRQPSTIPVFQRLATLRETIIWEGYTELQHTPENTGKPNYTQQKRNNFGGKKLSLLCKR
jgi:hypothetical protein